MNESIKIPVKKVVFNKDNIMDFAKLLEELPERKSLEFSVRFGDERVITDDNSSLFSNRRVCENEIKDIEMRYTSLGYNNKIIVRLYNGDLYNFSNIELYSDNDDWMRCNEGKIREYLQRCKKVNLASRLYENDLFYSLFPIIPSCFTIVFINRIIHLTNNYTIFVTLWLVIYFTYATILHNVKKLFPSVEILLYENNSKAHKKRAGLIMFWMTFIAPLIVNVIWEIVKYCYKVTK